MPLFLHLPVIEQSQTGESRRLAVSWALGHGCPLQGTAQLALTVAELARNLALHTSHGGALLLRLLGKDPFEFEVISLDAGPGRANFSACLNDGYSTAGTSGTGLGAVRRASAVFDYYSQSATGTALLSQLCAPSNTAQLKMGLGVVNVPKKGEIECGDSFGFQQKDGRARLMIADGLGHGPLAAEASLLAVKIFEAGWSRDLPSLMEQMHNGMRATRGAAIAIAEIDPASQRLRYAGVGNIAGVVLAPSKASHLVSLNGTVGSTLPKIREFTYPWEAGSLLIMNSDGVKTQWRLDRYAGLLERHPGLIAGILFRDFSRGTDDTTVAALKLPYEHRI
ncbi:MAG: hypothetical protein JWO94_3644 [Verrucomicrobiaceae bacterium]|nr:hypothetical protein [Verrucomicrobiaceae bacterium]